MSADSPRMTHGSLFAGIKPTDMNLIGRQSRHAPRGQALASLVGGEVLYAASQCKPVSSQADCQSCPHSGGGRVRPVAVVVRSSALLRGRAQGCRDYGYCGEGRESSCIPTYQRRNHHSKRHGMFPWFSPPAAADSPICVGDIARSGRSIREILRLLSGFRPWPTYVQLSFVLNQARSSCLTVYRTTILPSHNLHMAVYFQVLGDLILGSKGQASKQFFR